MAQYHRLSLVERKELSCMLASRASLRAIGKIEVEVLKSNIEGPRLLRYEEGKGWESLLDCLVARGGHDFNEARISWSWLEGQATIFKTDRRKPQLCT